MRTSPVPPTSAATGTAVGWLTYPVASLMSITNALISVRFASSMSWVMRRREPADQAFT